MDLATGQPSNVNVEAAQAGPTGRLTMTLAARADSLRRRREARVEYDKKIDSGWMQLSTIAEGIAKEHHKSLQRVKRDLHLARPLSQHPRANPWNAYCHQQKEKRRASGNKDSGRSFLPNMAHEERDNYKKLSPKEKEHLAEQHSQRRQVELKTRRVSSHTRANDVALTMKHAQETLLNLQSRTGVEIMMYTVPGTTDLPIKGTAWTTDGVKSFMGGTMNIDDQDILGKMEGHVMHGLKGAAENYAQRKSTLRKQVRQHIVNELRIITQDPNARMEYVHYWDKVVRRYLVLLEGWPKAWDFKNLSESADSLHDLNTLDTLCKNDLLYWRKLTQIEFDELDTVRARDIAEGRIVGPNPRKPRSDRGQKRKHADLGEPDDEI